MHLVSYCVISFVLLCSPVDIVDEKNQVQFVFAPVLDQFVFGQYQAVFGSTVYVSEKHAFSVEYPATLLPNDVGYAVYFQRAGESQLAVYIDSSEKMSTEDIIHLIVTQQKDAFGGEYTVDKSGSSVTITSGTRPDWYYRITFFEANGIIYGLSNIGKKHAGYDAFVTSFQLQ